ncbi:MAG: Uncharacterized protein K0R26_507 [Bacteroidota bacterium]|nr:Uncharacterized protein [Bacteroidota bacterium]
MLKIKNIASSGQNFTPAVNYLFLGLFLLFIFGFTLKKHPYYVGVVDIKYNTAQKVVQVSARLFTNDLEDALRKVNHQTVDLLNPPNKPKADSAVFRYIKEHLKISLDSQKQTLSYLGYEKEEESIWIYLEIKKIVPPKKITLECSLLYDYIAQQINIAHAEIRGIKKSSKVTNPENKIEFNF